MNSHPMFTESNNRHRSTAFRRIRRLLIITGMLTIVTVIAWTVSSVVTTPYRSISDKATNQTIMQEMPKVLVNSYYFWDINDDFNYGCTLVFQIVWLFIALCHANLTDTTFCCFVIFACEQLKHLKESLRPLMRLSATLDTNVSNAQSLFRINSPILTSPLVEADEDFDSGSLNNQDNNYISPYVPTPATHLRNGHNNPNGFTKKQEQLVRSAIKYWVERHKHVVRFVYSIGDCYGAALLIHMLISTVTLTLLSYQATKIDDLNLFAFTVIGYLVYSLGQVFLFCVHGNELIEESSSVMEAAYSCQWYEGSEEAKTFVQIVCQQCQKSLTVSGAKFFTVSLDLFASVLGAVITYFMVLIQLK